jgi:hypothetical protein
MKKRIAPVLAIASLWSGQALAQSETPERKIGTELSKETGNPGDPTDHAAGALRSRFSRWRLQGHKDTFEANGLSDR